VSLQQDSLTAYVAGLATVAPWVFDHFNETLNIALAMLGIAWMIIQIYYKVKNKGK